MSNVTTLIGSSEVIGANEATVAARGAWLLRVRDYIELCKPRIAVLELFTVMVAGFLARWNSPDLTLVIHAMIGTGLVASSASAANHWLERHLDRRMLRTVGRPLAAGRLSSAEGLVFVAITGLAGVAYLWHFVRPTTALLGLSTWVLYVMIYTPMKLRSTLNTLVGAVAGALPILMGWSAVGGHWNLAAFGLFGVVLLWQFPHFMAIAWLYRDDYAAAGMKMLPVVDRTGRAAGLQAVCAALLLIPVSLLPAVVHLAGVHYVIWALLLGLAQLACAIAFFARPDQQSARWLLRASLIYLPSLLLMLILGPFGNF